MLSFWNFVAFLIEMKLSPLLIHLTKKSINSINLIRSTFYKFLEI